MITISEIIKYLEQLFPKHLAYEKDPIGLQIGTANRPLTKAIVTLDLTEAVVYEAIESKANLIIAHHPFIYQPMATINTNTPKGKIIELCLKNDISVYAMHTNYDIAPNGMNDCLAEMLGLTQTKPLIPTKREEYSKLAIYVPDTHATAVRNAMATSGVGQIANYSHCIFTTEGTGYFKPLLGSTPYYGQENEIEQVKEVKVEGVVKSDLLSQVLEEVKLVHPYEEIAYDFYSLNVPTLGIQFGLGRIGQVSQPGIIVSDYIKKIKKSLNLSHVRFVGNLDKKIKTVAIIGGSGSSYASVVKAKKADLFITGDVGYHDAQDALDIGLNILDIGHHAESIMKQHVSMLLNEKFGEKFTASAIMTDPFKFI